MRGPKVSLREIIGDRPLFVTRWWGWRPDRWAAVTFPYERTVDRWIEECPNGGFVLGFASHHKQEQIPEPDRGRVFGVYEFVPEKVVYTDASVIDPAYLADPFFLRDNKAFRWPFGMRAVRAWEFSERVMTGGTLPNARSLSFEATTDMVRITGPDFTIANQHLLQEVPVFNRDFRPQILRNPNQQPDQNYLLMCEDIDILKRMPAWQYGDVLFKPGIASDFENRCDFLNNHAIAKIFGLSLAIRWTEPASSSAVAAEREAAMIEGALKLGCRTAAPGQREFLFGKPKLFTQIVMIGRPQN